MVKNTLALTIGCLFSLSAIATDMATVPKPSNNQSPFAIGSAGKPAADSARTYSVGSTTTSSKNSESSLYVVSNKHVNRIVTPFKRPTIVLDSIPELSYKQRGNVIYLALPSTLEETVAGWVTEKDNKGQESSAIRVLFKPMPVKPQEVQLTQSHTQGSVAARKFERSHVRNDVILKSMSSLALNQLPVGYQMGNVNGSYIPTCTQQGLTFDFFRGQFASGGDYVISIGTVENNSNQAITFNEYTCYSDGVVGVAAYPEIELLPTEKAEVYVMYYREKNIKTSAETPRKSLLGGE
jgi:conjugal transfer pilus assembly protein TraK